MKKLLKPTRQSFFIMACLILFAIMLPSAAQAAGKNTVKVAYIDYNNFLDKSENGTYTGYGAEYLYRIAEYTGWEYEFVEMDWPTALEAVKDGTVDLYCVARQTVARQAEYDFSLFPLCNEQLKIYTLPDSKIYFEDYAAFDGLKVGVLEASVDTGYFREYSAAHGFTTVITEYPTNREVVAALQNGLVDMIAIVDYAVADGFRLVGSFGASPA